MRTWEIVADGINQGKTLPQLSPRETMVLMLALMERSDIEVPEHESSSNNRDLVEESEVLMDRLADHFRM